MPYKFQTDKIKLPPGTDRRVKLTPEQKANIFDLHHKQGYGIRELTRMNNVSRRLIQFICYPERQKRGLEQRAKRGGWRQYYNKEYHRKKTQEHRQYKKKVLKEVAQ